MPSYNRVLDIHQGFNYNKDVQTPVGFITALKIGTKALNADLTCKNPTNATQDLAAVAVLSAAYWHCGVTDAVNLDGQISTANRQEVAMLVLSGLTNIQVEFKYAVYDYDPIRGKYFLAFHSNNTAVKGLLELVGDDLSISVADDPLDVVQSPLNYSMSIGIAPQPIAQTLHIAVAEGKNVAKAWGMAVR